MTTYQLTLALEVAGILSALALIFLMSRALKTNVSERQKFFYPFLGLFVLCGMTTAAAVSYEHYRPLEAFLSSTFSSYGQKERWRQDALFREQMRPQIAIYNIVCPTPKVMDETNAAIAERKKKNDMSATVVEMYFVYPMPGLETCFWNSGLPQITRQLQ